MGSVVVEELGSLSLHYWEVKQFAHVYARACAHIRTEGKRTWVGTRCELHTPSHDAYM